MNINYYFLKYSSCKCICYQSIKKFYFIYSVSWESKSTKLINKNKNDVLNY